MLRQRSRTTAKSRSFNRPISSVPERAGVGGGNLADVKGAPTRTQMLVRTHKVDGARRRIEALGEQAASVEQVFANNREPYSVGNA